MSWQVDGVYYHSYEAYQRALARQQASQASRAANTLRKQMSTLQKRIKDREAELAKARNDLSAHTRVTEGLRTDVAEMRNLQAEAERQRRQAEDESQRSIEAIRADQAADRETLASLEREQRAHTEATRQAFETLNEELTTGLQDAENRRQQSEERLEGEIRNVEAQVREDREVRLAKESSDLDRAKAMITFVEQDIQRLANVLPQLGLREDTEEIRNRLDAASELYENKDAAASLAVARSAGADARSLETKVRTRDAELSAARQNVLDSVRYLRDLSTDAAAESYFSVELAKIRNAMERLERRADKGYDRYDQLAVERVRDEEVLSLLRGHILEITKFAPTAQDLDAERVETLKKVIRRLVEVKGPMSVPAKPTLAIPQDRKSDLSVTCHFGDAEILVSVELDGAVRLDGAGYDSNATCEEQGLALVQVLDADQMGTPIFDTENRAHPVQREAPTQGWGNMTTDLDRLEGML